MNLRKSSLILVISWLFTALLVCLVALLGLLRPWMGFLVLWPVFGLMFLAKNELIGFNFKKALKKKEIFLCGLLGLVWTSHLLQVFVPETGFDAVWYHFPVIRAVAQNGGFIYLPTIYQSLNPLFTDLLFFLGFQILSDLGAKLVAFLLAISLIFVSYMLTRIFLDRFWSLLTVLVISTFQVVSWQSASFYVDVANAFWQVSWLWLLLDTQKLKISKMKRLALVSLLFGASLATKLFSLLLLPFFIMALWFALRKQATLKKIYQIVLVLGLSFLIAFPFYYFSFMHTGNPFYSFSIHLNKLHQIGGNSNIVAFVGARTLSLPFAFFKIVFTRDYLSPLFVFLIPSFVYIWVNSFLNAKTKTILVWGVGQFLLWWYLPPTSTRYTLSGFICLLLLIMVFLRKIASGSKRLNNLVIGVIAVSIVLTILPRLLVNKRSLMYILGLQTKQQYLNQFMDGWIDPHLRAWHQIE